MYKVRFSIKAEKALKKIPKEYQNKIKSASIALRKGPFALDIKKLGPRYTATHRLRVGAYRLFLIINTTTKEIYIVEIHRRTTQTYR